MQRYDQGDHGMATRQAVAAMGSARTCRTLQRFRDVGLLVFNIAQCDGLPDKITAAPQAPNPEERDALIDAFIAATGVKFIEENLSKRCLYITEHDVIVVPGFKSFRGRPEFYAAAFHELVH